MRIERKLSHIGIDQMIYSGGNFAVALIVGLTLPTADFGRFILAQAALQLTLQVSRGISGDPILAEGRSDLRKAGGIIMAIALAFAAILLAAGAALFLSGQQLLGATALLIAAGCAFEGARQQLLVTDRLNRLIVGDVVWSSLSIVGLAGLAATSDVSLQSVLMIWGAAAAIAALCSIVTRPRAGEAIEHARHERSTITSFVADNVLSRGAPSLALLIIGSIVAERDVGLIGIGRTLAAPVQVVFAAAVSYGVVKFAKSGSGHPHFSKFRRGGLAVGAVGGLAVVVFTPVAAALFDEASSDILQFSVLWGAQLVVASIIQVERVRVRVDGQTNRARPTMIATAVAVVAGAAIGSLAAGPIGGLAGLVSGTCLGSFLWRQTGSTDTTEVKVNA